MDYYDDSYDSYDYYDAYESQTWDGEPYDHSGYSYDDYDNYGEYDQEEEYWYDAEDGGYDGYDGEDEYGMQETYGNYDGQGEHHMEHGQGYDQDYDQGYDQNYEDMGDDYGGVAHEYGHIEDQEYGGTGSQQQSGGYQTGQEAQYWEFGECQVSSHFHESDAHHITGAHRSAMPDIHKPTMDNGRGTISNSTFDQHLSPIRAARSTHFESYQSFLPSAMFEHGQHAHRGPSRALSLNRSQQLTLQPAYPTTDHAASPTGMFRDLFWKTQGGGSIKSAGAPDQRSHLNRSPLSRTRSLRTPSRSGLLTPRSADGAIHHSDRGYLKPDTSIGFLAPLTPS